MDNSNDALDIYKIRKKIGQFTMEGKMMLIKHLICLKNLNI